jgi:SAM-dependent methyltransferase
VTGGPAGEYAERGDYHREGDRNWRYYPVYVEKMRRVRAFLDRLDPASTIVDLGCGEGVLVEEYVARGFAIQGVDANYASRHVRQGDITSLPDEEASFDVVLCLDVIEHLSFAAQERAFAEIGRILKPEGRALVTLPNLAHFASRISFLLAGKLLRTSTIDRHPGDRPIGEYLALIRRHRLKVVRREGLFPTYPLIAGLTYARPALALPLHRLANALPRPAGLCFLNLLELARR